MMVKFKNNVEGRNAAAIFDLLGRKKNCVIVDLLNCYLGLISEKNLLTMTEEDYSRIATRLLNMKDHYLFVNGFPASQQVPHIPFMYNMYPPASIPQQPQQVTPVVTTVKNESDSSSSKKQTKAIPKEDINTDNTSTVDNPYIEHSPTVDESTSGYEHSLISDLQSFGINLDDM